MSRPAARSLAIRYWSTKDSFGSERLTPFVATAIAVTVPIAVPVAVAIALLAVAIVAAVASVQRAEQAAHALVVSGAVMAVVPPGAAGRGRGFVAVMVVASGAAVVVAAGA